MVRRGRKETFGVAVSRFGHDPIAVTVSEGATVEEVLDEAGITLAGREVVYNAGEKVSMEDEVEENDVLSIISPKAAGNR